MRRHRARIGRLAAVVVLLATAAIVSGCTSHDAVTNGEAPRSVTIRIADGAFEPRRIEVAQGGMVEWINDDVNPHQFESLEEGLLSSPVIAPSERWSFEVTVPGDLAYYDVFRPTMKGVIVVR